MELQEWRQILLRKANRTRGHALVSLLALRLVRELDRRLAPLGLTVEDALDGLSGVRLIAWGDRELGLWRLPDSYAPPQAEILVVLSKLSAPVLSRGKAAQNPSRFHGLAALTCAPCAS